MAPMKPGLMDKNTSLESRTLGKKPGFFCPSASKIAKNCSDPCQNKSKKFFELEN
jgi:hypothetical protein